MPRALSHPWNLSLAEAAHLQDELAARVRSEPLPHPLRTVAGIDVSFPDRDTAHAAVVVLSFPDLSLIAQATADHPAEFPYVPGFLSFREAPAILAALDRLTLWPDLLICDAHGRAHPRRLGLAAHLGVLLDHPTIGCAKSKLYGEYVEPAAQRGAYSWLYAGAEIIGAAVRTQEHMRPVFVSVGHRVDLPGAIDLVLACTTRYRLPEPTRLAHLAAAASPPPGQLPLF